MIATMALASCGTENDDVQIQPSESDKTVETTTSDNKVQMTFKAVYSNGDGISKTAIENRTDLVFSAGDDIKVFDGSASSIFTGDISSGTSATCNFTGTANPEALTYYAVYPSSALVDASSATATIPAIQTAEAGTFYKDAHVMVATASGAKKEFAFKTANAFIRITAPRNLKSIEMKGNNGEAIADEISISGYPELAVSGATGTTITLSGTIEEGKEYYISYAPADFTKGITLILTDANDKQGTYTTKAFKSKPNQVNNIKAEKLDKAFYVTKEAGELNGYLRGLEAGSDAGIILNNNNLSLTRYALKNNKSINVKLVLPNNVTEIGENFKDITNLIDIEMPGVTSLDNSAFQECTNLKLSSLPSGITSIGRGAFLNCTNLAITSIPEGVSRIEEQTFSNSGIESITIHAGVDYIGYDAFYGCNKLKSITILGNPEIEEGDQGRGDDYNKCPAGTVINVSKESYARYTEYWDYWNSDSKPNITVNVLD